jgi:drug/metabolite transporter (DMT)-like permease
LLAAALLGGGNAVAIRFSNRELAPLWGATVRFALAAAIFVALVVILRLAIPRGQALVGALLYGAFNFAGSFGLAYFALVRLHAGLAQTLLALVPLITLLLAVIYRQERLRLAAAVGTLLALVGIAVISGAPFQEALPLPSLFAVLGSAVCVSQAAVLVRWFPQVHPITMNAVGATAAAALLVAGALIAHESLVLPQRFATWHAIGYLVPIGTVVVFALYLVVLRYWAASRAAYTFVLVPIVTILLSAKLDNERVGVGLALGGLLVVAGVYVGALRSAGRPSIRGRSAGD